MGLLTLDPNKRLGNLYNGVSDARSMPWFQVVNWPMVENKKIQPPWFPELTNQLDCKYFDQYPDSGDKICEPSPQE